MTTERNLDSEARKAVEGGAPGTVEPDNTDAGALKPSNRLPPAGPHADPALQNLDATPGVGTLTPSGEHDDNDSTSS